MAGTTSEQPPIPDPKDTSGHRWLKTAAAITAVAGAVASLIQVITGPQATSSTVNMAHGPAVIISGNSTSGPITVTGNAYEQRLHESVAHYLSSTEVRCRTLLARVRGMTDTSNESGIVALISSEFFPQGTAAEGLGVSQATELTTMFMNLQRFSLEIQVFYNMRAAEMSAPASTFPLVDENTKKRFFEARDALVPKLSAACDHVKAMKARY